MGLNFSIRAAELSDLLQLLALYLHLNPSDPSISVELAARRLDEINRLRGSAVYLGLIGTEVIASCTLIVIPNLTRSGKPYALIENVVTHSLHRGQGYGTHLLRAAVDAAWQADCYKVMLLTGSKKPSTIKFYEAAGFEQSKTGFQRRRIAPRQEAASDHMGPQSGSSDQTNLL